MPLARHRRLRGAAIVVTSAFIGMIGAPAAWAQTGSGSLHCDLGTHFACGGMEARDRTADGAGEREWAKVVVIWRAEEALTGGRPRRSPPDTAAFRVAGSALRAADFAARERERNHFGGSAGGRWWGAELSGWNMMSRRPRDADTLFVLGRSWRAPMRDTAVIVLVDGVFGGDRPPVIVGAITIPSPSRIKPRGKRWVSGDTTFIVEPKPEGPAVEEFLRSIPEVRVFLERRP